MTDILHNNNVRHREQEGSTQPYSCALRKSRAGFSLVELLLVIGITFIIGVFMFPISVSFLQSQILDETTELLLSSMRRAEMQAMYEKHDSSFGVKLLSDSYVLFEGDSYSSRNVSEDEVFQIPSALTVSGIDEVVFLQRTGIPSTVGTIVLTRSLEQHIIDLNNEGKLEQL